MVLWHFKNFFVSLNTSRRVEKQKQKMNSRVPEADDTT